MSTYVKKFEGSLLETREVLGCIQCNCEIFIGNTSMVSTFYANFIEDGLKYGDSITLKLYIDENNDIINVEVTAREPNAERQNARRDIMDNLVKGLTN